MPDSHPLRHLSPRLSLSQGRSRIKLHLIPMERFSEIVVFILKALFQEALFGFWFFNLVALSAPT